MTPRKTLFILIAPKGAGKTYIGTLVSAHFPIHFLRVEPIWLHHMQHGPQEVDGWTVVEAAIATAFETHNTVMIESLGAGEGFAKFHHALQQKYRIRRIRIQVDLDTCLERVRARSNADHIPVSDDKVQEYNRIAAQVVYNWDLVIDNAGPARDRDILAAIQTLLPPPSDAE